MTIQKPVITFHHAFESYYESYCACGDRPEGTAHLKRKPCPSLFHSNPCKTLIREGDTIQMVAYKYKERPTVKLYMHLACAEHYRKDLENPEHIMNQLPQRPRPQRKQCPDPYRLHRLGLISAGIETRNNGIKPPKKKEPFVSDWLEEDLLCQDV